MSTTSLPANVRASGPKISVKPPVLASDILREEVAPRAPARTMIRVWLGSFAAACALSAVAARLGLGPHTARVFEGSLAAAVIAAIGAVVPAPYIARAMFALLAGLALLALGVLDRGPLAPLGQEGALRAAADVVLATALPGSLLLRARYRALREARIVLTVTLLASLPAVVLAAIAAASSDVPLVLRVVDGALVVSAMTGLFGYMGAETSGGCGRWAALILSVSAARVAAHVVPGLVGSFFPESAFAGPLGAAGDYGTWGHLVAGVGMLAATTIAAFGLFQILALALGSRAREVDVHQIAATPRHSTHED